MERNALSNCALWRAESGAVADWPVMRHSDSLAVDEVRVWCAHFDLPVRAVDRLAGLLGDEEPTRARRFRFQRDATRFVVSRAALEPASGCVAAIAAEGRSARLECYAWVPAT